MREAAAAAAGAREAWSEGGLVADSGDAADGDADGDAAADDDAAVACLSVSRDRLEAATYESGMFSRTKRSS